MTNTKIHFHYLSDPYNPQRVVTVAQRLVGSTIEFALAVCKPDRQVHAAVKHGTMYVFTAKGDQHRKATGRALALSRLENVERLPAQFGGKIPMRDYKKPLDAIARHMCTESNIPSFLQRTFDEYLYISQQADQLALLSGEPQILHMENFGETDPDVEVEAVPAHLSGVVLSDASFR